MMAVFYSYLVLVFSLLTGGGNDLLDYVATDAYWQQKQVEVSLDAMLAELEVKPGQDVAALIKDLGSPDAETRDNAAVKIREVGGVVAIRQLGEAADSPDVEVRRRARTLLRQMGGDEIERGVRRLMAIRTLGEMHKAEAVAKLTPLLKSEGLFVADYARVAIDRIEGRQPAESRAVPKDVAKDVWLLPAACGTVGQLVPRNGTPPDLASFAETFKADAAADPDAKKHDLAASLALMLVPLADRIGNVRVDAISFGISGPLVKRPPQGNAGYLALAVRGRYNAEWLRTLLRAEKVPSEDVDGVEVFRPDGETALMMPSDELFVFVASDDAVDEPAKALAATVKTGKPAERPADDPTRKLVESIDTKQVLWGVSAVTPAQKALPVAEAFDTITLVGRRNGKALELSMTATGQDAAQVKAAVEKVNKHAEDSAEFLEGMQVVSTIKLSVTFLRSIKATADGTRAALTAKLDGTPAAVLSLPFLTDEQGLEPEETPANPRLRK